MLIHYHMQIHEIYKVRVMNIKTFFSFNYFKKVLCLPFVLIVMFKAYGYLIEQPELKNSINIKIYLRNNCVVTKLEKPLNISGNIIESICSEPIISNDDIESIKLIQVPYYEDQYGFEIFFYDKKKIEELTKRTGGLLWIFNVNDKPLRAAAMNTIITDGSLYLPYGEKEDIINLIGKETFEVYSKIWRDGE